MLTLGLTIRWAELDVKSGEVSVGGDGNGLISFTAKADIGRYLAHVLTKVPPLKLDWRILRIEGERTSLNRILEQYTVKTGQKVNVTYRSKEELEAAVKANPYDLPSFLQLVFVRGEGVVGKPEEVDNKEFPGWNPKTVVEILAP
ncbi:hypothetical protein EWM64_g4141 [Hericium alpestre]|uniref:NmrA-like domain-containing protein n=1 Tax=Hericium alpestre TaxID=135208 RepID=A0A4Z0A1Z1_9AGAM|nr:hypothetical protein EWM64_g4141 [Hericium alpestre]